MDEDNCMVDVARYFIEFTHSESCGKCVPCRVGLDKALRMLNRFTRRHGHARATSTTLDELCRMVRDTSLCGLGQSAPNPVLTSLRHFRHEFEDHIVAKRCRAGVCEDLALSPCENSCPLHMNIPRFLAAVQGGAARGRVPVGDPRQPAARPPPGASASTPATTAAAAPASTRPVNMRDVHRLIADEVLLSDRFDDDGRPRARRAGSSRRGARSRSSAPGRPASPAPTTWRSSATA